MKSLILCPVGSPITTDPRFDASAHWRTVSPDRLYETLVVQYGAFIPEPNTYDRLIQRTGQKWALMKSILHEIDYRDYEYIGFFDDDLITDRHHINHALTLAHEKNFAQFQLSMADGSDVFYPVLRHNPIYHFTTTNFIEVMGPFIHRDYIPVCLKLWDQYDIQSGWGFDKVLSDITQADCAVIHSAQMYHPKRVTSYDKTNAFREMDHLLTDVMPKFMKTEYDKDWSFVESQVETMAVMR